MAATQTPPSSPPPVTEQDKHLTPVEIGIAVIAAVSLIGWFIFSVVMVVILFTRFPQKRKLANMYAIASMIWVPLLVAGLLIVQFRSSPHVGQLNIPTTAYQNPSAGVGPTTPTAPSTYDHGTPVEVFDGYCKNTVYATLTDPLGVIAQLEGKFADCYTHGNVQGMLTVMNDPAWAQQAVADNNPFTANPKAVRIGLTNASCGLEAVDGCEVSFILATPSMSSNYDAVLGVDANGWHFKKLTTTN